MANAPGNRLAYPTGKDLIVKLQSAGMQNLSDPESYAKLTAQCDSFMAAAIDKFEEQTDFVPFLAGMRDQNGNRVTTPTVTTRLYDPPGPERVHTSQVLSVLRGGNKFVEIDGGVVNFTSVTTGLTYDDQGNPQGGDVRVLNRDFTLRPSNALQRGRPFEWLEFFAPLYGMANSIQITAMFGFTTQLTEDVWQALLAGGAAEMEAECTFLVTEGAIEVNIRDAVDVKFPVNALQTHFAPWRDKFRKTIVRYRREDVGL